MLIRMMIPWPFVKTTTKAMLLAQKASMIEMPIKVSCLIFFSSDAVLADVGTVADVGHSKLSGFAAERLPSFSWPGTVEGVIG